MGMKSVIRVATSPEDRERLFQFRYRIYVEEMHRTQKHADPVRRRIEEPLDASAHLFLAEADGQVIGTARANYVRDTDLGYYRELLGFDSIPDSELSRASITTKLMVSPEHRSGTLATRLALAVFNYGRALGIRYDFIDCNPHLEAFFERLGYVRYIPKVHHPEFGSVQPMRLDSEDRAHLERIGSPFLRSLRRQELLPPIHPPPGPSAPADLAA